LRGRKSFKLRHGVGGGRFHLDTGGGKAEGQDGPVALNQGRKKGWRGRSYFRREKRKAPAGKSPLPSTQARAPGTHKVRNRHARDRKGEERHVRGLGAAENKKAGGRLQLGTEQGGTLAGTSGKRKRAADLWKREKGGGEEVRGEKPNPLRFSTERKRREPALRWGLGRTTRNRKKKNFLVSAEPAWNDRLCRRMNQQQQLIID